MVSLKEMFVINLKNILSGQEEAIFYNTGKLNIYSFVGVGTILTKSAYSKYNELLNSVSWTFLFMRILTSGVLNLNSSRILSVSVSAFS